MGEHYLKVHCRCAVPTEGRGGGQGKPGLNTKHERRVNEPRRALYQRRQEAVGSSVPRKGP